MVRLPSGGPATPGAARPDPTWFADPADPIPAGRIVTIALGAPSRYLDGRRVVRGTVLASVLRRHAALDLHLGEAATWLHGMPPVAFEVLPSAFRPVVRVQIGSNLNEVVAILLGDEGLARAGLQAWEVPFRSCWPCRTALPEGAQYCPRCGRRVQLGPPVPLPFRRSTGSPSCGICGDPAGAVTMYCPACGHEHGQAAWLERGERRGVTIALVEARRVRGHVAGRVCRAAPGVVPARGAALILELDAVDWVGPDPAPVDWIAPAHTWLARLAVALPGDDWGRLLAELATGRPLRATELVLPCRTCGAMTASTHCTQCGTRARLRARSGWAARVRATTRHRPLEHCCGNPYRPHDRHCGGCGECLAGYQPVRSRFVML